MSACHVHTYISTQSQFELETPPVSFINNDLLLFSATNEKTPYEQLLHYCLYLSVSSKISQLKKNLCKQAESKLFHEIDILREKMSCFDNIEGL